MNLPLVCAGAFVQPRDVIVADDGVCVVPRAEAAKVVQAARKRAAFEAGARARLAAGELGLDLFNTRERLTSEDLLWVDEAR